MQAGDQFVDLLLGVALYAAAGQGQDFSRQLSLALPHHAGAGAVLFQFEGGSHQVGPLHELAPAGVFGAPGLVGCFQGQLRRGGAADLAYAHPRADQGFRVAFHLHAVKTWQEPRKPLRVRQQGEDRFSGLLRFECA